MRALYCWICSSGWPFSHSSTLSRKAWPPTRSSMSPFAVAISTRNMK